MCVCTFLASFFGRMSPYCFGAFFFAVGIFIENDMALSVWIVDDYFDCVHLVSDCLNLQSSTWIK